MQNVENDLDELIRYWQDSPYPSTKLTSYFAAYARLFGHLRGTDCVFVETGVLGGGSLFMWRRWLGDRARIVGIDLNPEAKKWESHGFEIHIGDQGDWQFWDDTFRRVGSCDAFLDDGGHQSFQQIVTLESFLRFMTGPSVIAIEDTHTSYMSDFSQHGDYCFLRYAKDASDILTARVSKIYPGRFKEVANQAAMALFSSVYSVQFFGSLVAFHVNTKLATPPNSVWNRQPSAMKDFRYGGIAGATVSWPDPFRVMSVNVKGGQ
jgi:hypothetical protein